MYFYFFFHRETETERFLLGLRSAFLPRRKRSGTLKSTKNRWPTPLATPNQTPATDNIIIVFVVSRFINYELLDGFRIKRENTDLNNDFYTIVYDDVRILYR